MKTKLITLIILCIGSTQIYAQEFKTIDNSEVCDESQTYNYVAPVESFKSKLTISIDISNFTVGRDSKKINKTWTGSVTDETPIIKVSKDGAIRIAVGRVIENGKKYYIYRIHMYKKIDGCWEDRSSYVSFARFNPGVINNGYGIGTQGTSEYIGFSGILTIE
ncbi:MAG: hypothetical protein JXR19_04225 [Bacteroidia bacterium]